MKNEKTWLIFDKNPSRFKSIIEGIGVNHLLGERRSVGHTRLLLKQNLKNFSKLFFRFS